MSDQVYQKYKNSGIERIGEIPEKWQMIKIKYLSPLISEKTEETEKYEFRIALENIESFTGRLLGNSNPFKTGNIFKKGDLLFNKLRPYLYKVVLAPKAGIAVTEILVLRPEKEIHNRFLFYRLISYDFIDIIDGSTYGAKMPRANWSFIGNLKIPLPSYKEQMIIASFLDEKLSNIDDLIVDKENIVGLLQEYRQALITEVVTKGLDPSVEMKESGIEWIGDIPIHWEIKKLKYVSQRVLTGSTPPTKEEKYFEEEEIDWYTPADLNENLRLYNSKRKIAKIAIEDGMAPLYEKYTVLLVGIGATLGKIGIIEKFSSSNQQINAIIFKNDYNPYYGAYYLDSIIKVIKSYSVATTLAILNQARTKDIIILDLPKKEQNEIVDYIAKFENEIFESKRVLTNQIELLKEFRQSLISETVSGKIDVRNHN